MDGLRAGMAKKLLTDEARFLTHVEKTEGECWLWQAGKDAGGYGLFSLGSRKTKRVAVKAHRFSYEMHIGPIPPGEGYHGTCVLHKCDVRNCVNPAHLFLGTHQDNMDDMRTKGRGVFDAPRKVYTGDEHWTRQPGADLLRGEAHGRAKLTEAKVADIREAHAEGMSISLLARIYKVSRPCIKCVLNGRTWGHVQ